MTQHEFFCQACRQVFFKVLKVLTRDDYAVTRRSQNERETGAAPEQSAVSVLTDLRHDSLAVDHSEVLCRRCARTFSQAAG